MNKKSLDIIEKEAFGAAPSPFETTATELKSTDFACLSENGVKTLSLNGCYQMISGSDEIPDFTDSIPANIPCTVQTALFEAGKIPDPMFGKNDKYAREAAYNIWWFKYEFDYDLNMQSPKLHFDGVCHKAHFYLNGTYLGEHSGMFGGPDYNVKEILKAHNTLIVKIEDSPTDRKQYSEYADFDEGWKNGVVVNCVYGWHYACIPTRGIWADVSLVDTPACPFERPFILTSDYKTGKMSVCIKAFGTGTGKITVKVSPYNFEGISQYFSGGFNCKKGDQLHYSLNIKDHKLWWPNGYGDQPLYRFEICLEVLGDMPQRFEEIIGIRQIEMHPIDGIPNPENYNWRFFINGKYIFIKGTNWCTTDALLRCTEERYDRFLSLAKHQHLQLLRAWGGGLPETDYFYHKCDELGLMVQQEWPTCWDSPKTQPADALIETARIHTVRLRNHASLVRWAGGNELSATDEPSVREMAKTAFELDGTRPFHRTSPYAGSLHNYSTFWEMAEMDHALNLRAPFIGEFGMASSPNIESVARYVPKEELSMPINRDTKNCINYHTPRFNEFYWPEQYNDMDHLLMRSKEFCEINTLEDFVLGTQLAQGVGYRHTIEAQRADNPKAAGVCYYKLTDVYPACSWSTADYYGVPKISYYITQDAFAPLHAMLTITSINAADSYPVFLLDDNLNAKGKSCNIEVTVFNDKLETEQKEQYSFIPESDVQRVGDFKTTEAAKANMRFISVRLYVDGILADDTFYLQNYKKDIGCITRLPETSLTIKAKDGCAVVTNNSNIPAMGVFIENLANDTEFTTQRNFLCLMPNESRTVAVSHTKGLSVRALNFKRIEET